MKLLCNKKKKPDYFLKKIIFPDVNSEVKNEPVWEEVDYGNHRNNEPPGQVPHPNKIPVNQDQVSSQPVNQDPMSNPDLVLSNQETAGAEHEGEIKNPIFTHSFGENIDMPTGLYQNCCSMTVLYQVPWLLCCLKTSQQLIQCLSLARFDSETGTNMTQFGGLCSLMHHVKNDSCDITERIIYDFKEKRWKKYIKQGKNLKLTWKCDFF